MGKPLVGGELVEQGLIPPAGLDSLFAHPGLLADHPQGHVGLLHQLLLLLEQELDGTEKFLGIAIGDAARQHRCRRGLDVEREFPEHETHLAGIDIFRPQHRKDVLAERGAMRATHRRIFGDGHRRVGGTERHVRQRYRLRHQRGGGVLRHGAADRMERHQSEQRGKPGPCQREGEGPAK